MTSFGMNTSANLQHNSYKIILDCFPITAKMSLLFKPLDLSIAGLTFRISCTPNGPTICKQRKTTNY